MLDIFEKDTLYIFDESKYYIYNGKKFNWTNLCNGLIVDVENKFIGTITVDGEEYVVFPQFCYPVEVDVISREEKNIYGNKIKGTLQAKSSFQGDKPKEFNGKIFLDTDKNNNWKDAGIISLFYNLDEINNLECEPINNHSKELTFDNKEYYFDVNLVDEKDIKNWMYKCNGAIVDVINANEGFVLDNLWEEYHMVYRKWCRCKGK